MSYKARIRRIERAMRLPNMNPDNIGGALSFLWTGDEAEIPDGLNLAELQAAARMIPADKAAEALGLDKVRAALGDEGGDVLGYIARKNPADGKKPWRIVWPEKYANKAHETEADYLLARLGFGRIITMCYQGDNIDEKSERPWRA